MNSCACASCGRAMICVARRVRLAVGDVLPDRRVEQLRVLQHEPDLPAQRPDA